MMILQANDQVMPTRHNEIFSIKGKRVWIVGHGGMVGSALMRRLGRETCDLLTAARREVDLRDQEAVALWTRTWRPDVVVVAAGTVGGIHANRSRPAEFIYDNLVIATNIIHAAAENDVEKLLYLGSSCIYPRSCTQPMVEDQLLSGPLEPTNQWYAMAKLSGLMLARAYREQYATDFITALPTNLFGPGDNYDLEQGHAAAALLRKMHEAKVKGDHLVEIWGTGSARRDFLHVDDLADALVHLISHYSDSEPVNVGSGVDISITEFASLAAQVVGYQGAFTYNSSMPDGTPRKQLDVTRMTSLGWRPRMSLFDGLKDTYTHYLEQLTWSICHADH